MFTVLTILYTIRSISIRNLSWLLASMLRQLTIRE